MSPLNFPLQCGEISDSEMEEANAGDKAALVKVKSKCCYNHVKITRKEPWRDKILS